MTQIIFKDLLNSVSSVLGLHPELQKHFDRSLRDTLSSSDLVDLLSGTITTKFIKSSFIHSLQSTATLALEMDARKSDNLRSVADQLWNPLVATLLKHISLATPTLSPPKVAPVKKSSPAPTELPDANAVEEIRRKLRALKDARKLKFDTAAHAHVKCKALNCSFCSVLFSTVHITKCIGHKKCSTVGWYPHVGVPLWRLLRAKHDAGAACQLSNRSCKEWEIPSLNSCQDDVCERMEGLQLSSDSNPPLPNVINQQPIECDAPIAEEARGPTPTLDEPPVTNWALECETDETISVNSMPGTTPLWKVSPKRRSNSELSYPMGNKRIQ